MPVNLNNVTRKVVVRLTKSNEDSVRVFFSAQPDAEVLKDLIECEKVVRGELSVLNGLHDNIYIIYISSAFKSEEVANRIVRCLREDHRFEVVCQTGQSSKMIFKEVSKF